MVCRDRTNSSAMELRKWGHFQILACYKWKKIGKDQDAERSKNTYHLCNENLTVDLKTSKIYGDGVKFSAEKT